MVQLKPNWAPFVRTHDKWDLPEKIRTYLVAPFLVPFRIASALILLCWYFLALKIGMFSFKGKVDFSKPLEPWRRAIFVQAAQPVARTLLFIFGFYNIKTSGSGSLFGPKGKANIITSNHTSYLDILVMMATCPDGVPSFVAKRGVMNAPLIGYKSKVWQGLYVDNRTGGTPGTNVANQIAERAQNLDLNPVLIFPEGTTTNGDYLMSFRSGAFIGGHPVKPVAIKYKHGNFSPAWETCGGLWHAFRLFSQFKSECEVTWLPVYYPNEQEKADPKLYANNVRKLIGEALQVPLHDATYNDKLEYHYAIGHSKPPKTDPKKTE